MGTLTKVQIQNRTIRARQGRVHRGPACYVQAATGEDQGRLTRTHARHSTTLLQALSAWRLAISPNSFCSLPADHAWPQPLALGPISDAHQTIKAISRCQLCGHRYPTTNSV